MQKTEELRIQIENADKLMTETAHKLSILSERLSSKVIVDRSEYEKIISLLSTLTDCQSELCDEFLKLNNGGNIPDNLIQAQNILFDIENKLYKAPSLEVLNSLKNITTSSNIAEKGLSDIVKKAEKLCSDDLSPVELAEKIAPYKIFADAVRCDNIDERANILRGVRDFFSSDIINCVFWNDFSIHENLDENTENMEISGTVSSGMKGFPEDKNSSSETESVELASETSGKVWKDKYTDEDIRDLEELKKLNLKIGIRKCDIKYTINKGDTAPIDSPKRIKKDIERFPENMAVIKMFSKQSVVCPRKNKDMFTPMLEKGYLNSLESENFDSLYYVSSKGKKAFSEVTGLDKSKRTMLKDAVKYAPNDDFFEKSDNAANNIMAQLAINMLISKIPIMSGKIMISECCSNNGTVMYSQVKSYTLSGKDNDGYLLISAFSSSDDGVLALMHAVNSELSQKTIGTIMIASDNFDECNKLLEMLKKKHADIASKKIGLYSLLDNEFISDENSDISDAEIDVNMKNDEEQVNAESYEKQDNENMTEELAIEERFDENIKETDFEELTDTEENAAYTTPGNFKEYDGSDVREAQETPERETKNYDGISAKIVKNDLKNMLFEGKLYCACTYLNILSGNNVKNKYYSAYSKMAYAANDPAFGCRYSSSSVMNVFANPVPELENIEDDLYLSAALRAMFYNESRRDYEYQSLMDTVKGISGGIPTEISTLMYKLNNFRKNNDGMGIDAYANYRIGKQLELKKNISISVREAKTYYEKIPSLIADKINNKRLMNTKKDILGHNSDVAVCLKGVADDNREMLENIEDFLNSHHFLTDSNKISSKYIGEYIDHFWYKAGDKANNARKSSALIGSARSNLLHTMETLLGIIRDWVIFNRSLDEDNKAGDCEKDKKIISEALDSSLAECKRAFNENPDRVGLQCVIATLEELTARMDGTYSETQHKYFYIDFLKYESVMLDKEYLPFNDDNCTAFLDGFSLTKRILNHSKLPDRMLGERLTEIFTSEKVDEIFGKYKILAEDYGSARLIINYLEETGAECDWSLDNIEANCQNAEKELDDNRRKFVEELELDQSYGKIDDVVIKEAMRTKEELVYKNTKTYKNFGYYNRFIAACKKYINDGAKNREELLRKSIERLEQDNSAQDNSDIRARIETLIEQAKKQLNQQDYTVVEDIINRIERSDLDDYTVDIYGNDTLDKFISEFDDLYNAVKPSGHSGTVNIKLPFSRPQRREERQINALIENFPFNGKCRPSDKIERLLRALNFNPQKVEEYKNNSVSGMLAIYDVTLARPNSNTKQYYNHPIAPFGSIAVDNGFRVICLSGNHSSDELIKKFTELGETKNCMVLLDYPLALPVRRELAYKLKKKAFIKIFMVVDGTVVRFLSKHYNAGLISQMLMELTMPFSYYQPYAEDSSRQLPIEMFMGRKDQLNNIKSPSGANIVYGGRQLGKTAILKMAQNEIDHNENGDRAVYIDARDEDYKKTALRLSTQMVIEDILPMGCETDDWYNLCISIQKRLNDKNNRIPFLLVLIDEADAFVESCKSVNYSPIAELKKIQLNGTEQFKFVIAGLRNVVHFEKERAEGNNSVLAHLQSLNIAPFTAIEARELLEVPLHCLGIRFPNDKSYLIANILASTNYFPGLIHTYCAKLVKAMQKDYAGYSNRETPPYDISEDHFKKVLADPEFNEEVIKKFTITLELGEDKYYSIIAHIMAFCSKNGENSADGFTADYIYSVGCDYDVKKFDDLDENKVAALMDEMCQLNVLTFNKQLNTYSFARNNFIQLLGDTEKIEQKIIGFSEV